MATSPAGSDWTDREIDIIVAEYFDMLRMELRGEPFVKAERNAALQHLIGRSRNSIEFKHQNISAVLLRLGMSWIQGYKPMANFQRALIDGVERHLDSQDAVLGGESHKWASPTFRSARHCSWSRRRRLPASLRRPFSSVCCGSSILLSGTRETGSWAGKARSAWFFAEQASLRAANREDLARQVRWVSAEDGDGAGYDMRSCAYDGAERLIEVKTTTGHRTTPFFLSETERKFAEKRPDAFRLVRLYDFILPGSHEGSNSSRRWISPLCSGPRPGGRSSRFLGCFIVRSECDWVRP